MSPTLSELALRSQSDERLARLARAGHDRAFATIVERYRSELHAFARRLNSDGRAEDVVQQAFLSALVSLRAGTEVAHVRGWLYQIVRNAATKVRPLRDLPLDDVVVAAEPLEDVVERRATALSAVTELARLPQRQRDALIAIALEGRAGADVAVTMGLSEGALRQLVHRARTTVRAAATAVMPWPLARWLAAMGSAPGPEAAAAAGVASVGGFTGAKVGALLATGVLATTVAVLPPLKPGASPKAQHHLARPGHAAPSRPALALSSSTGTAGAAERTSRIDGLTARARSELLANRAVPASHRTAERHHRHGGRTSTEDVSGGRQGDGGSRSDQAGRASGRDDVGALPTHAEATSSDGNGSPSSGQSTQSAGTASQGSHDGGAGGGSLATGSSAGQHGGSGVSDSSDAKSHSG